MHKPTTAVEELSTSSTGKAVAFKMPVSDMRQIVWKMAKSFMTAVLIGS